MYMNGDTGMRPNNSDVHNWINNNSNGIHKSTDIQQDDVGIDNTNMPWVEHKDKPKAIRTRSGQISYRTLRLSKLEEQQPSILTSLHWMCCVCTCSVTWFQIHLNEVRKQSKQVEMSYAVLLQCNYKEQYLVCNPQPVRSSECIAIHLVPLPVLLWLDPTRWPGSSNGLPNNWGEQNNSVTMPQILQHLYGNKWCEHHRLEGPFWKSVMLLNIDYLSKRQRPPMCTCRC